MSKWLNQVFQAGQVNKGNVVRRSVRSVRTYASETALKAEVTARRFHMAKINDQYVIVCNPSGAIQLIC